MFRVFVNIWAILIIHEVIIIIMTLKIHKINNVICLKRLLRLCFWLDDWANLFYSANFEFDCFFTQSKGMAKKQRQV